MTPITPVKDCPFCGVEPTLWEDSHYDDKYVVECPNCSTSKRSEYSHDDAINDWNSRPTQREQTPVAFLYLHPLGEKFYHVVDASCAGYSGVIPVYAFGNADEVCPYE